MKLKSLLIFGILLLMISCVDDEAGQIIDNTPNIFETIAASPNHNTLEELLVNTGLDQTLNTGTFTVFASTDEAFENIDLSNLTNDELTQILLFHVITGKFESTDLSTGYEITNATEIFTGNSNNLNIYVNKSGDITLNGQSTVTTADEIAFNGVIHVVDAVLTIPDITSFVSADDNLSTLNSALTRDDQPDFLGTLSSFDSPSPFTVFAPSNDAFTALITELSLQSLDDIGSSTLTSALNTHVIAGNIMREENLESGMISTLGSDININASTNTITDQSGRIINIFITDIQAANGVIHVVDKVILP
ncbi:fasciclin domain-containing protein [Flavobacteriaceae bacterium 14752]|uniref:fasciclin domain-containing protein n=1 Tax=Mesohalobacter salilacus TaxID=2491711 RepID=UPI000F63699D|nr:fasciclin domain-containing protein [Flavobacteriaceae bacterium 14752]